MFFERYMVFEEKIKSLNRTKRFAGRFLPIEAGRPIEKHGLRVDYCNFVKFSVRDCGLILTKFEGFFCKMSGIRPILAVRPADRTAENGRRRGMLWCQSSALLSYYRDMHLTRYEKATQEAIWVN
jgi:hypothetical protein